MIIPLQVAAVSKIFRKLELRQYKNGLASLKNMFVLKLPPFFPHRNSKGKRAAISKLACVSQKRVRSYNVFALIKSSFLNRGKPLLFVLENTWKKHDSRHLMIVKRSLQHFYSYQAAIQQKDYSPLPNCRSTTAIYFKLSEPPLRSY